MHRSADGHARGILAANGGPTTVAPVFFNEGRGSLARRLPPQGAGPDTWYLMGKAIPGCFSAL